MIDNSNIASESDERYTLFYAMLTASVIDL